MNVSKLAKDSGFLQREIDLKYYQELEQFAKRARAEALEEAAKVVLADAFAVSFQSMGQYRTACAAAIRGLK